MTDDLKRSMRRFVNQLAILQTIDEREFIGTGLPATMWPEFRDNPIRYFFAGNDKTREALFSVVMQHFAEVDHHRSHTL